MGDEGTRGRRWDTLANAWHEFTTTESDPIKDESWEKDVIEFSVGDWTNDGDTKFYMVSGYDPSSEKGFLCWLSLVSDTWSDEDSKALYEAIEDSVSYDP